MSILKLLTGRKKVTEATLEIEERKPIVLSSTDFVWDANSTNSYFKIVADGDDVKLNVLLAGETDQTTAAANLTYQGGYYPFPKGEGSNCKVLKVYKDAGNTIGTVKLWAVR